MSARPGKNEESNCRGLQAAFHETRYRRSLAWILLTAAVGLGPLLAIAAAEKTALAQEKSREPARKHHRILLAGFDGTASKFVRSGVARTLDRISGIDLIPLNSLDERGIKLDGSASVYTQAAREFQLSAIIAGDISQVGRKRYRLQVTVHNGKDGSVLETLEYESHWTKGLIDRASRDLRKRLPLILKDSEVPPPQVEVAKVELEDEDEPATARKAATAPKQATSSPKAEAAQDEGKAKPLEPKRSRQQRKRPGILELRVAPRYSTRDFHYEGEIRGALRTYTLKQAAAFGAQARWYPGAHFTQNFPAHIGLTLGYEHVFSVRSYTDGRPLLTESYAYDIGTRVRIPLSIFEFGVGFGYGRHQFAIADNYVPDVDYHYLRAGMDGSLRVGYFAGGVGLGTRMLLKTGELGNEDWFPRSSIVTIFGSGYADGSAFDADIWAAFVPIDQLYILVGARFLRYSINLNSRSSDYSENGVAERAIDTYISAFGGLELRL